MMLDSLARRMEDFGVPLGKGGISYLKNTGIVTISRVIESVISYIIIILISRYLGAQGLGQYSFLFSFVGIFFIIGDFGMNFLLIKDLSKDFSAAKVYYSQVFSAKVLLLLVSFGVFLVSIFFIGKESLIVALVLVGIIKIVRFLSLLEQSLLRVKNDSLTIASSNFLERLITLTGAFIALVHFHSLTLFVLVFLFSEIMRFIYLAFFIKKYVGLPKLSFNFFFLKQMLARGYPFMLVAAFSFIYIQLDTVILSFMKSDTIVGWYNAGYGIINVINIFPALLLVFGFPIFSKLHAQNKAILRRLLEKMLFLSMVFIVPVILFVFFAGGRLIDAIYSFQNAEPAIAFNILIVAEVFIFLTTIMGQLLSAADYQHRFARIGMVGALLNTVLNLALIPRWSLYGAAFSTLVTYFLMFLLMFSFIQKRVVSFSFAKYVSFSTVLLLVLLPIFFLSSQLHLIFFVTIGGMAFLLCTALLLIVYRLAGTDVLG